LAEHSLLEVVFFASTLEEIVFEKYFQNES
jgi:hypothetical protein